MSGLIKCGAFRPEMCRVFWGGVAEATSDGVFIDLGSVSSEPTVACDELNKFTEGRATEFSQSRVGIHGGEPLLSLGGMGLGAVSCGGPIVATIRPFLLPALVPELKEYPFNGRRVMEGARADVKVCGIFQERGNPLLFLARGAGGEVHRASRSEPDLSGRFDKAGQGVCSDQGGGQPCPYDV